MRVYELFDEVSFKTIWKEMRYGQHPNLILVPRELLHHEGLSHKEYYKERKHLLHEAYREFKSIDSAMPSPEGYLFLYPLFEDKEAAVCGGLATHAGFELAPFGALGVFYYDPECESEGYITEMPWEDLRAIEVFDTCVEAYGRSACAAAILRTMTANGYSRAECAYSKRRFEHEYREDPLREMAWQLFEECRESDLAVLPCLDPVEEAEMEGWSPRTTVDNLTYRAARSIWADDCYQDHLSNLEELESAREADAERMPPKQPATDNANEPSGKEAGVEAF